MSQPGNCGIESTVPKVVVVMVPVPSQGHMNQLLHLTRIILSKRGIPVHFCGSSIHNRQAKNRLHGWELSTTSNVYFHDFQLPQIISTSSDTNTTNKLCSSPDLLPFLESLVQFREPLGELLRALSITNQRVVVVHDVAMAFAAHEASFVSNAEAYSFIPVSAFASLHYIWEAMGPALEEAGFLFPEELPRVSLDSFSSGEAPEFFKKNGELARLYTSGEICNTCSAVEEKFMNALALMQPERKYFAIGPFNPVIVSSTGSSRHRCLEWLDKQPQDSVIYVSFGSITSIVNDQLTEIAIGLERSEQRFIWVIRDADRGDAVERRNDQVLPDGFEERIKGIGMLVRDWAPQLEILAHPSTGGFVSHCGWNSCMESFSMGVPIIAWPMHSEQPKNALLIADVLKVGLLVRDWAHRNNLVFADRIESLIRKLMVSDEGNMITKKARQLGASIREGISEGGTSAIQFDAFLSHITR